MIAGFTSRPALAILDGAERVRLLAPLTYRSARYWYCPRLLRFEAEFTIPRGFECDLASVPGLLRSLAPSWMQTAGAGTLHDWLYKTGLLSRRDADAVFYEALRCKPATSRVRAYAMWMAVRVGGWVAWRRHRAAEGR